MPKRKKLPKIRYKRHDKVRLCSTDKPAPDDERTPFERDRSRIIHSAAFRRLQGKTQVFTAGEGDFYRTRLTHSIEVAQIGKGLALRLGADPDLIEAICLTHDIGHPPFGHAGESELKELMKSYGGFEANAQNIRILTRLEKKSNLYEGLNLTRGVFDGQLKYKNGFAPDKRKFVYDDDLHLVAWASDDARTAVADLEADAKSFDCAIMDWADEVAYAVHDLEDSIHARYIDSAILRDNDHRVRSSIDEVKAKFAQSGVNVEAVFDRLRNELRAHDPSLSPLGIPGSSGQRKADRKQLTSFLIHRYISAVDRVERTYLVDAPVSDRYGYQLVIPPEVEVEVDLINKIVMKFVIRSPQVQTLEEKGKHIIRSVFEKLMKGDNALNLLPDDWKEFLYVARCEREKARVVSDYISGMTDDYAQKTYAKLFLPNFGSIYDIY